ncbi:MAG: response regulator transcription factor [Anaerolineae bacterium]
MAHILTVDDEADVLGTLSRALTREGHEIEQALSAQEALTKLSRRIPNLLILDITMPGMDGLTLCQHLRADVRYNELPILFLTAHTQTEDVVAGLDAGGDDYVTKPFELAELTARVRALLRRNLRGETEEATLELGGVRLDSLTYQATVDGNVVQLTSTEHKLLRFLMEHPDQTLSPRKLLEGVWEYPPGAGDPDLVRAHIRNLRVKLGKDREIIHTVHSVGYKIVSES